MLYKAEKKIKIINAYWTLLDINTFFPIVSTFFSVAFKHIRLLRSPNKSRCVFEFKNKKNPSKQHKTKLNTF